MKKKSPSAPPRPTGADSPSAHPSAAQSRATRKVAIAISPDRASATIWLDPAATKAGAITATAARRAGAK